MTYIVNKDGQFQLRSWSQTWRAGEQTDQHSVRPVYYIHWARCSVGTVYTLDPTALPSGLLPHRLNKS